MRLQFNHLSQETVSECVSEYVDGEWKSAC